MPCAPPRQGQPQRAAKGIMGVMQLPVMPPVKPMLAKPVTDLPEADSVDGGVLFVP